MALVACSHVSTHICLLLQCTFVQVVAHGPMASCATLLPIVGSPYTGRTYGVTARVTATLLSTCAAGACLLLDDMYRSPMVHVKHKGDQLQLRTTQLHVLLLHCSATAMLVSAPVLVAVLVLLSSTVVLQQKCSCSMADSQCRPHRARDRWRRRYGVRPCMFRRCVGWGICLSMQCQLSC
jgi:hypothetical protein